MQQLQDLLYQIAHALRLPVLLALVTLIGATLVQLGTFLREGLARRGSGAPQRVLRFTELANSHALSREQIEDDLERVESALLRRVDRSAFLAKIGPLLGLAGTLIPLGPGLKELGAQNVSGFADDVVVAFAATVAGLAICAVAFVVSGVRGRWYDQDLRQMERRLDAVWATGAT